MNKAKSIKKSFCERWIGFFECLHLSNVKSGSGPILPEVIIESRSTTLKLGNIQSAQSSSGIWGQ